ncbi:hypothetical protein, partial [Metamycoplasma auris]
FIDYISRPSAVYVQDIDDDRNSLINQMEIKKMNFVEFINSRTLSKQQITKELKDLENKSGLHLLFNKEPKDIDLEIAKKQFEKINKNQHIWEMIINPGDLGIKNKMLDKNEWNEILNKTMRNLLRANNLDPNNIIGYWALHSNTNYPHVHLGFFEKLPNHINKYRPKGKFDQKTLKKFQFAFENAINEQRDYKELFDLKNSIWNDRKEFKNLFINTLNENNKTNSEIEFSFSNNDLRILNALKTIRDFYKNQKNKSYAVSKDNDEVREAINEIYAIKIASNIELKEKLDAYNNQINKITNTSFEDKETNLLKDEFINKEKDEFERQIGNAIIKNCLKTNLDEIYKEKKLDTYSYIANNDIYKDETFEGILNNLKKLKNNLDFELNRILWMRKFEALKAYRKNISTVKAKIIL